jgi:hypothetical protein
VYFLALAADYDGTIAHDGTVDDATVAALERFKETGRKLVLVTGAGLARSSSGCLSRRPLPHHQILGAQIERIVWTSEIKTQISPRSPSAYFLAWRRCACPRPRRGFGLVQTCKRTAASCQAAAAEADRPRRRSMVLGCDQWRPTGCGAAHRERPFVGGISARQRSMSLVATYDARPMWPAGEPDRSMCLGCDQRRAGTTMGKAVRCHLIPL